MTSIALKIGPLDLPGYTLRRSGIRWLCEDGHVCRPGEVIAYCNISLTTMERSADPTDPFPEEKRDLQIAFAPRRGGRLSRSPASSQGGLIDILPLFHVWAPDFVLGQLEPASGTPGGAHDGHNDEPLRLLFLAGRRVTELAESHTGLLPGWHDRSRAWWADSDDRFGTVLSFGICDQDGIFRGERNASLELFEAASGPAQVVFIPDDGIVPCGAVVLEQLKRTPRECDEIEADFARSFAGPAIPTPGAWIFGARLMSSLRRSPVLETYPMLTRWGIRRAGPPDAVILSLGAELPALRRHKRLGYSVNAQVFRVTDAGPTVEAWLRRDFELVRRSPDQVLKDYRELIDAVRARQDTRFLILNTVSSLIGENIPSYAGFDAPLRDTLASVRAKELNLMLHDLARERDVSIVDVDAISAELGTRAHVPDGFHLSGAMEAEVRAEILRLLRTRNMPGFGAREPGAA